jgi:hypothetical protein
MKIRVRQVALTYSQEWCYKEQRVESDHDKDGGLREVLPLEDSEVETRVGKRASLIIHHWTTSELLNQTDCDRYSSYQQ